jgi:hypothetical protein
VLNPGLGDAAALRKRLESFGVDVAAIDRVAPSLEDVFLDVVEKAS